MARELRASTEELETTSVWPPDPQEIYQSNIKIPKLLQLFLRNLFTSESDQFFLIEKKKKIRPVSDWVDRLVKSLAQDMIFSRVVEALNQLRHCISYYEVNALETAYADSQFNQQLFRAFIPTGVQPSSFVTFVFNNCVQNPENLS